MFVMGVLGQRPKLQGSANQVQPFAPICQIKRKEVCYAAWAYHRKRPKENLSPSSGHRSELQV
jgi:hypothetical protein